MGTKMTPQLNNLMTKQYTLYHIDSNWTILFTVNPNNPDVVSVDQINHDDPKQNSSKNLSLDGARREWKHFVSCGYSRQ
jgi:hypothetical protein